MLGFIEKNDLKRVTSSIEVSSPKVGSSSSRFIFIHTKYACICVFVKIGRCIKTIFSIRMLLNDYSAIPHTSVMVGLTKNDMFSTKFDDGSKLYNILWKRIPLIANQH